MKRKVENKNMAMNTRKAFSNTYRENNVPSSKLPQSLTPQKLDERREKGLCFNCDKKYSKGHKCGGKKLFYIYCEEEEPKEQEQTQVDEIEVIIHTIPCHALARMSTPQTFNIKGYIKNLKKRYIVD